MKLQLQSTIKKYYIQDLNQDNATCSCYEQLSLNLPCRHIFFSRIKLELSLFNASMVPKRHQINLEPEFVDFREINLVSSIPDLNNVKSMITTKSMTQTAKYNAAFRIAQELCNSLKYLHQTNFEKKLSQLMKMNQLIKKDIDFDFNINDNEIDTDFISTINNSESLINQQVHVDEEEEPISSSQSSIVSTNSSDFNYNVGEKIIAKGVSVGRKKLKKAKVNDEANGRLSMYESSHTFLQSSESEMQPKTTEIQNIKEAPF